MLQDRNNRLVELVAERWGKHPRLRLVTVAELLEGKRVDMPQTAGIDKTFAKAPKVVSEAEVHPELVDE